MIQKPTYEELKHKVEELEESEKKYRHLFETAMVGMYRTRIDDGKFLAANQTLAELMGYDSIDQFISEYVTSKHYTDPKRREELLYQIQSKGRVDGFEIEMTRADGSLVQIAISSAAYPKRGYLEGVVIDITRRKQAEEALRESENKYRTLTNNLNVGVYRNTVGPKGKFIEANPAIVKLFGYDSKEEFFKVSVSDLYRNSDDRSKFNIKILQEGAVRNEELNLLKKDGTSFIGSVSAVAVKDENGEVKFFDGIIEDISERKRVEEALRNERSEKETILDNLVDHVVHQDLEHRILWLNQAACKSVGMTRDDLVGHHCYEIWAQSDRQCEDCPVDVAMVTERLCEQEKTTPDGRAWFIRGMPIRDADGTIVSAIEITQDITERKQAEKALLESEEKYRNIFENVSDFLYFHDLEGNFIETNFAFKKEYGLDENTLTYPHLRDMMPEQYKPEFDDYLKRIQENGKDEGLLSVITKDGRELVIEYKSSLVCDSRGTPIGAQGAGRDITERIQAGKDKKRLEAQLQQAQKMESLGTLAGGIAHDFNNLLMGIQGRTSLMLLDTDSYHPHFEHLKGIEEYVKSASDLTRQLLAFAREGKYEVRPTDPNEIIQKSSEMFGRTKKEISIYRKKQENIWTVEVDRSQIEQVMLNLYVNAWQSMPGGGELYIGTENVMLDDDFVKPYDVKPGKYVKVSVTDTGVGMDKATQVRIFDPFFTTKEMGRGTGLGLASVYGIINNHGGIIKVSSEKGEGATFDIYLPATEKGLIKKEDPDKKILKGSETILLVDDEEMILKVGKQLLENFGYTVLTARSGKEAIEIYQRDMHKIDMIVLDMIMPGIGGGEVYDRLHEIDPNIKVLLSSGYSIDGQAKEILARGCTGFIQKPFNMKDLSQKLREILK